MIDGLPDIPEEYATEVQFDEQYEVQDHHIVAVFLRADAPYRTVGQVAAAVDMSRQGVRNRLATLEELGVVDSSPAANGRIYWLSDERSDWPIPPDVAVVPVTDEPTIGELWARRHVKLGVLAAGLAIGCTLAIVSLIAVDQFAPALSDTYGLGLAVLVLLFGTASLCLGVGAFVDWVRYRW